MNNKVIGKGWDGEMSSTEVARPLYAALVFQGQ